MPVVKYSGGGGYLSSKINDNALSESCMGSPSPSGVLKTKECYYFNNKLRRSLDRRKYYVKNMKNIKNNHRRELKTLNK